MRDIINTMSEIIMKLLENYGAKNPRPSSGGEGSLLELFFQTIAIRTMKEMIAIRTASRAQPRLMRLRSLSKAFFSLFV